VREALRRRRPEAEAKNLSIEGKHAISCAGRNARVLGIGRRLVDECLRFAPSVGYAKMVLRTDGVLVDARRIYERPGFTLIAESHHSFGKHLVGQTWERER
jgi:GNAT superfamily N-acetyltransferase